MPVTSIYLPSTGAQDWQWLLAQPGLHWKHAHSAMSLADVWEAASPWPAKVDLALEGAELSGLELLLALPEHKVELAGKGNASQTDLFVLARRPGGGGLVAIAVEGKATERFGDKTVAQWRDGSGNREERLRYLLDVLEIPFSSEIDDIRYQLLHRTASAILEARRFGAADAVMLVHSFSATHQWFDDFARFATLLHADVSVDAIAPARTREDAIRLHLGWVSDTPLDESSPGHPGPRFDRAVMLARTLHADQQRKGGDIPYLAHLLGVASLVLEDGGTEDEAIAALLHDAVEDQGGAETLKLIRRQFGDRVAQIVEACSDTDVVPKPPWRARKEAYIAHLADADPGVLRVSLADKLHNARAILFDLQTVGDELWTRFNAERADTIWYYQALADAFASHNPGPMVEELRRTVAAIVDEPGVARPSSAT